MKLQSVFVRIHEERGLSGWSLFATGADGFGHVTETVLF